MNFADMHLHMATQKALLQRVNHYHLHEPYLRKPRRAYLHSLMSRLGKQLEQAGKSLQERYNSAPHMAQ